MRILLCGDSFSVTDPDYPGLHWSEKILNSSLNYEICNLAYGGSSNALIAEQLTQGIRLNPDFVILSFTGNGRYELDNNVNALPNQLSAEELADYIKSRYVTNQYKNIISPELLLKLNSCILEVFSPNFERIKNYFFICYCLQMLKIKNIPFCFTLGGFEYQQDYAAFINSNFMENFIVDYKDQQLLTNLWYHHSMKVRPYFHVDKEPVQTLFANECLSHIGKLEQ
jgi:hypothetical protein